MIIFNQKPQNETERIANLQTSLATVYSQLFSVRQALAEKEVMIGQLKKDTPGQDTTLTLIELLIKLVKLLVLPKKGD
ncbi:hypothetical protein HYU96_04020 [Candidatus Daviesbacteria bacterium]|nr:hypothetical protein [Candidatus Daviesbacteria bacterium]